MAVKDDKSQSEDYGQRPISSVLAIFLEKIDVKKRRKLYCSYRTCLAPKAAMPRTAEVVAIEQQPPRSGAGLGLKKSTRLSKTYEGSLGS